jgi:hypothetical protein
MCGECLWQLSSVKTQQRSSLLANSIVLLVVLVLLASTEQPTHKNNSTFIQLAYIAWYAHHSCLCRHRRQRNVSHVLHRHLRRQLTR